MIFVEKVQYTVNVSPRGPIRWSPENEKNFMYAVTHVLPWPSEASAEVYWDTLEPKFGWLGPKKV